MSVPQSPADMQAVPSLPETACPHCGAIDTPHVVPGTGPHAYRANCPHCGKFVCWVSRYSHEERVHRREQYRRAALGKLPPTVNQCAYLVALGYEGEMPKDRAAASALIDQLTQGRGAR